MDYKPEAVLTLTNFGGISIMIDPEDDDYLYYKWYFHEPERAKVYYVEQGDADAIPMFKMNDSDTEFNIMDFIII